MKNKLDKQLEESTKRNGYLKALNDVLDEVREIEEGNEFAGVYQVLHNLMNKTFMVEDHTQEELEESQKDIDDILEAQNGQY